MCGAFLSTRTLPIVVCARRGGRTLEKVSEQIEEKRKEEQLCNEKTTVCSEAMQDCKEQKFTNQTELTCIINTGLETPSGADLPNIPKNLLSLKQKYNNVSIPALEAKIGKHRQELSEWRETELRLKTWLVILKKDYRKEKERMRSLAKVCEELEHETRNLKRKRALCDTRIHELACSKKTKRD